MDTHLVPQSFNKPTAAVHIRNGYTATERKLVNVCLYEGVKDNFSSEFYYVNVWDALSLLGCDKSKNSAWLKNELFEALREKPIRWNILKKDRGLQEWTCSFLAGYVAEPEEGKLAFQFNPMVIKYFRERRLYSRLLLQIEAPIKSGHALTLYEFLNDELHRNKVDERSIVLRLTDLRALFDIGEEQYQAFKYFNDQAVKPAFAEVNTHTDIQATYQNIREKRRVVAFDIRAKRRKNFQLAFNLLTPQTDSPSDLNRSRSRGKVVHLLQAYGISESKANQLVQNTSDSRIVANVKYTLEQQRKQKVTKLPSYLVKAIEENYASPVSTADADTQMKSAWTAYQIKQAQAYFEALLDEQKAALRQEFEKKIKSDPKAHLTRQKFENEDGWNSQWVQHEFRKQVLMALLKTPEKTDLAAFAEWWPQEEIKILLAEAQNSEKKIYKN